LAVSIEVESTFKEVRLRKKKTSLSYKNTDKKQKRFTKNFSHLLFFSFLDSDDCINVETILTNK